MGRHLRDASHRTLGRAPARMSRPGRDQGTSAMMRADAPLPPIGHADLHVHPSGHSVGRVTGQTMYEALRSSGLQVAVLADHIRIDVAQALVARARDEGIRIELVVGEEITTRGGHLVGVGLASPVPAGLSLAEAVAAVHEQGGIAIIAHPLLPAPLAASERLLVALTGGDPRCRPDVLEAMNPVAAWLPGWRSGSSGSRSAAAMPSSVDPMPTSRARSGAPGPASAARPRPRCLLRSALARRGPRENGARCGTCSADMRRLGDASRMASRAWPSLAPVAQQRPATSRRTASVRRQLARTWAVTVTSPAFSNFSVTWTVSPTLRSFVRPISMTW